MAIKKPVSLTHGKKKAFSFLSGQNWSTMVVETNLGYSARGTAQQWPNKIKWIVQYRWNVWKNDFGEFFCCWSQYHFVLSYCMKAENLKKNQQKIALLCEVFFSATYVYQLFNVCFHKNPKIKNEKQKYFVKNMKPPCKKPTRSWMLDDEVHILQLWEENYAQLLQVKRNAHNVALQIPFLK